MKTTILTAFFMLFFNSSVASTCIGLDVDKEELKVYVDSLGVVVESSSELYGLKLTLPIKYKGLSLNNVFFSIYSGGAEELIVPIDIKKVDDKADVELVLITKEYLESSVILVNYGKCGVELSIYIDQFFGERINGQNP